MTIYTLHDLAYAYGVPEPVREMLFALQDRITELEAQQQPDPAPTTYTLNTTKTAAVAAEFYWSPIGDDTPRGVKILLLGRGGVASLGHYHHKPGESQFWTHWAPLPKKP